MKITNIRKIASCMANNYRKLHCMGVMKKINAEGTQGVKDLYQYLRRDTAPPSAVVRHPDAGECIVHVGKQHEIMIDQWRKVYDKHADKPSTWEELLREFGEYESGLHDAPAGPPSAEMLFARAQRVKDSSSAGSDGVAPKELRAPSRSARGSTVTR